MVSPNVDFPSDFWLENGNINPKYMTYPGEAPEPEPEPLTPLFRRWSELAPAINADPLDGDHIRPGKTSLLFGQPGTFKSWWTMFRAMRIASNGKTVCWYDTEEGEAGFVERLNAILDGWQHTGAGYDLENGNLYYGGMERLLKDEKRLPAELAVLNPSMVVIDTGGMAAGGTIDESLVAAFWATLAASCPNDCAILVITHPTKGGSATAMGSQLWTSRSREIYEATDDRFGEDLIMTVTDVKLKMVPSHSYRYDFRNGAVETEMFGFMSESVVKRMTLNALIASILKGGSMTRADLWIEIKSEDEDRVKSTYESMVSRALRQGWIIALPNGHLGLAA